MLILVQNLSKMPELYMHPDEKAHTHEHGENGDDFEDDSESEHSTGHHGHNDNSGSHNITIDIPGKIARRYSIASCSKNKRKPGNELW